MLKKFTQFLGLVFGALVFLFLAINTYLLLSFVLTDPWTPFLGIVLFGGGFLYWTVTFLNGTKTGADKKRNASVWQLVISLISAVLCLLADGAGAALHMIVSFKWIDTATIPNLPFYIVAVIIGIAIWNLTAKFLYSILSDNTTQALREIAREEKAALRYQKLEDQTDQDMAVIETETNDQILALYREQARQAAKLVAAANAKKMLSNHLARFGVASYVDMDAAEDDLRAAAAIPVEKVVSAPAPEAETDPGFMARFKAAYDALTQSPAPAMAANKAADPVKAPQAADHTFPAETPLTEEQKAALFAEDKQDLKA